MRIAARDIAASNRITARMRIAARDIATCVIHLSIRWGLIESTLKSRRLLSLALFFIIFYIFFLSNLYSLTKKITSN